MFLDQTTIQQVRSHGAAIDRCAFQLVDRFCERFFAACPHLRRTFTPSQRRAMGQQWAWFIRHLGEQDRVVARFRRIVETLSATGMSHQDFLTARACLLEATREMSDTCNVAWGPAQESAWAGVLDFCMGPGVTAAPAARFAKAA